MLQEIVCVCVSVCVLEMGRVREMNSSLLDLLVRVCVCFFFSLFLIIILLDFYASDQK